MDSPERNRIPQAPTSSSPTTVHESPLTNFLENLSPIKSTKGTSHVQRINFSIPPPVFTSPRLDLQRDTTFIKREEIDAAGSGVYARDDTHLKAEFFQTEEKSCSPSGCNIDQYLVTDPAGIEDTTKSSHPFTTHKDSISKTDDDHVESNMFTGPYPGAQHEQFVPQAAEDQDDKAGGSYQSFHQPLQSAGAYKDSAESSRPVSRGSVKEADQHQRGIRRHLQFGVTMGSKHTGNETRDNANLSLPEGLRKFENMVPHNVEPIRISSSWQAGSHAQAVTFLSSFCQSQSFRSAQNCGNHDMSACTPSVLGLPSSSITRSESMGSDSTASKMLAGNIHAQEEKQMSNMNRCSAKDLDSISISSVAREIYARVEDDQQENRAAATVVPYEGRMLTSHNTDIVEELYQVSPKQNRKRAKPINESESCKRCNCKRSKCLKLYCECFAAGVYCLDSCACENCFNRPEYEDTVLDTRQQIEARNPLAFAPKVVKHAMNSPANMLEEGNWTTPSSARHKRGCNCKKSKCLKKYCECYQARVGCSNGCRCEGCNNSFGKKAESIYRRAEKWENTSHEQLDTLETRDDFIKAGRAHQFSSTWEALADISNLSPLSHCRSGAAATSASLNIRNSSKISHAQVHQGSNLQSSAGYLHFHHSPSSLTPESYASDALPELSSDSLLYNILKKDDTPEKLENTFTPTKAVKASSPNKKRVSPLQSRSQELRSSSSQELRSGRKFILPAVSSFPSLTPYSKLKDGVQHTDDDNQDSNSCQ